MTSRLRVTVAGAGVLGLTTALALADAGCAVVVVDPGGPNASSVAAGMIAPVFEAALDPLSRPHFDLLMASRDLWPALAARTGIALDRSGALAVGGDAWLEEVARSFAALNERPAEIGEATIQGLAPGLSDAYETGLLTREDWRVDAPAALSAIAAAAEAAGVTFLPRAMRGRGEADVLVVATGAAGGMTATAPELAGLSPIKGHIVRVTGPAAGAVVRAPGLYAVPGAGAGGGMIFGATMETGRSDAAVDEAQASPLLAGGIRMFPGLEGATYQISAGVRAATPDGLPLAGPSVTPGVMLATGARRNGWLLAPLVAQVVTAQITGRDLGSHLGSFAARMTPARLGGNT